MNANKVKNNKGCPPELRLRRIMNLGDIRITNQVLHSRYLRSFAENNFFNSGRHGKCFRVLIYISCQLPEGLRIFSEPGFQMRDLFREHRLE